METPITVRAIASGGKFIGALVGGFSTSLLLPDGRKFTALSQGSSGNTADLMQQLRLRTSPLPTNSDTVELPGTWAASAILHVDIDQPVKAQVSVTGPGAFPDQAATVTASVMLLPGIGLVGGSKFSNGLLLELPGLLVQNLRVNAAAGQLNVSAQVTMMCGCKIIDNNGIWISSDFSVKAQVLDGAERVLGEFNMAYVPFTTPQSTPSMFTGNAPLPNGAASVRVLAWQDSLANTGMATSTLG